jgi:hypothetical protein
LSFFGRARKRDGKETGTAESGPPQFFIVHCVEGHPIRGRRTEGYQALRCPECGDGVFVLPRSPLPEPPAPREKARRRLPEAEAIDEDGLVSLDQPGWQAPADEPGEVEIEWADASSSALVPDPVPEPEPEPRRVEFDPDLALESERASAKARRGSSRRPAFRVPREPDGDLPELVPADGSDGSHLIPLPEPIGLADRARRLLPKLVFPAVILVVAATIFFTLQRQWRRDYPRLAELGRTEGIEALEAGEFDRAHRILAEASRAVSALRGEVGGASEIIQAAQEAAIYVDLLPATCEEVLDQRARADDEPSWARVFPRLYENRSILVQGRVIGGPGGPLGRYDIDYRILVPGTRSPRVGRLCLDDLEAVRSLNPKPGDVLQLGARLASVEPDPSGDGWLFRLKPESGVLMSYQGPLKALGWEPTPLRPAEDRP